jgi:hypothetical protein
MDSNGTLQSESTRPSQWAVLGWSLEYEEIWKALESTEQLFKESPKPAASIVAMLVQIHSEHDRLSRALGEANAKPRVFERMGLPGLLAFEDANSANAFDHTVRFDLYKFSGLKRVLGKETQEEVDDLMAPVVGTLLKTAAVDFHIDIYHRIGDAFQVGMRNVTRAEAHELMHGLTERLTSRIGVEVHVWPNKGMPHK